mmetsp:Transcript_29064/g.52008  ORF Transcript_29064/g.52008 Transcript_29064/m.52008 type:complete len:397 (-) Transcript_29064:718-1908(-)
MEREVDKITRTQGSILDQDWNAGFKHIANESRLRMQTPMRSQSTLKSRDHRVIRSSSQKEDPLFRASPIRKGDRTVIEGVGSFIVNTSHLPTVHMLHHDQSKRWRLAAFDGFEDESCQAAVLQCFASSPGFLDDFLLDPDKLRWQVNPRSDLKGKLSLSLADLIKKARASHNRQSVPISEFLRLFMTQTLQYTTLRSYTPAAFFRSLMQSMHKELNLVQDPGPSPVIDFNQRSTIASVAADYFAAVKRIENSAVRDNFLVQLTAECACRACGHKIFNNVQDYCLTLPIPDTTVWRYLDLYHCLEAALAKKLSPNEVCANCMRRGSVEVQMYLTRVPPLLVLYFDRQFHLTIDLDTELSFPVANLDLRVYGPSLAGRYSLYGVVNYKSASSPPVFSA